MDVWKCLVCLSLGANLGSAIGIIIVSQSTVSALHKLEARLTDVEQPVCSPMMETREGFVGCVLSIVGDTAVFRACYSRQGATNIPASEVKPTNRTCSDEPYPGS